MKEIVELLNEPTKSILIIVLLMLSGIGIIFSYQLHKENEDYKKRLGR